MTGLAVRKAQACDLGYLLELENAAFATDRISRRSWIALLRSPSALVLVAEHQQRIVGTAVVLLRTGTAVARLYSIAAACAQQHPGVGQALLAQAMARARDAGRTVMRLESRRDNARAHRFFTRLGFEAFGAIDGYYQDGMGAVRFRCPLPASACPGASPPSRTAAVPASFRNKK